MSTEEYGIIVDSCCDLTPELEERLGAISIPLTMICGQNEYVDDDKLDLVHFMEEMEINSDSVTTAAPSPVSFKEAIEKFSKSFLLTISGRLSATNAHAEMGKALAEENGLVDTHVFDSKTASAGALLIALRLRELISLGKPKEQIINSVNDFIDEVKTLFVLEKFDNLVKNGRLNKVTEKIINVMNVKLIMGADGEGSIKLFAKPRGTKRMVEALMDFIAKKDKPTSKETLVIAHCNNSELVTKIVAEVKKRFDFREILVVPTRGISTVYANDKGIIVAF